MKVPAYISKKLSVLSFIGIIFVVFIHATIVNVEEHYAFLITQSFLRSIWNSFYPMFFAISGYLFFIGMSGSKNEFSYKFKSRFKSLVIPYVFWNISFLLIMLVLKYNSITGKMINSDFSALFSSNITQFLYIVFLKPIGFHLWFVRDLILIICFTPVIWYLINKIGVFLIIICVVLNLYFTHITQIGSFVPFIIGAYIAIKEINLEREITEVGLLVILIGAIVVGVLRIYSMALGKLEFYVAWIPFLLMWFGYDYLIKKGCDFDTILKWVPYTFFIYVFHEPYLNIFKKVILKISNGNEWGAWCSYFISPFFTVVLAIIIAKILIKMMPQFYNIITGGRVK
jgi:fucose 4-O-acetylase-like acetyltransferase